MSKTSRTSQQEEKKRCFGVEEGEDPWRRSEPNRSSCVFVSKSATRRVFLSFRNLTEKGSCTGIHVVKCIEIKRNSIP